MSRGLCAAISSDIDTLASIYKGHGEKVDLYSPIEIDMGLENLCAFLGSYGIHATLFIVGQDLIDGRNHAPILNCVREGHEIANHTMHHPQGFRFLPLEQKETEIAEMEQLCEEVTGRRPVGFRSPGWNISDDAFPLLRRRGYIYDSSVFPTLVTPLLKFLHWRTMYGRDAKDRTTLGCMKYMFGPASPYRLRAGTVLRKGNEAFVEFPVTVTPFLRLPFSATFLLAEGLGVFKLCYRCLRMLNRPIQFQFHLSDFIDYTHRTLAGSVPSTGSGQYVPQALRTSLSRKLAVFREMIDIVAEDYTFATLRELAQKRLSS